MVSDYFHDHKSFRILCYLILLMILIAWRLYGASYIIGSDELDYPYYANQMIEGTYEGGPYPSSNRLGLLLPTVVMFLLFGIKPVTAGIFPLLCSVISVFVLYFGLKSILSHKTALWAALLWAMFPANIIHATIIRPETPQALFIFIVIIYFYKSIAERECNTRNILIASLGLSALYLIRGTALVMILLLLIFQAIEMIKRKRIIPWFALLWVIPALTFAGECIFFKYIAGDYFHRLFGIEQGLNLGNFSGDIYRGWLILRRLTFDFIYRFATEWRLYGAMMYCMLIPIIFYLKYPDNKINHFKWWFIGMFLVFNFTTTSFERYLLLPAEGKYLTGLAPAGIIVLAHFITNINDYLRDSKQASFISIMFAVTGIFAVASVLKTGSAWGIILGIFMFALAVAVKFRSIRLIGIVLSLGMLFIPAVLSQPAFKHNREIPWRHPLQEYLGENPDYIYSDPRTIRVLRFCYGYELNDSIQDFPDETPAPGWIVVNKPFLEMDYDYYDYLPPKYVNKIESIVGPIWRYNDEVFLYRIEDGIDF